VAHDSATADNQDAIQDLKEENVYFEWQATMHGTGVDLLFERRTILFHVSDKQSGRVIAVLGLKGEPAERDDRLDSR
jgi:hypothetical protein